MKIEKEKAIFLIEEKISLFQKILTEAKYDNRFGINRVSALFILGSEWQRVE